MCDGSNHNLKVVYRNPGPTPGEEDVVRWCSDCGAVVVDTDVDYRTFPGRRQKMRFPTGKRETRSV